MVSSSTSADNAEVSPSAPPDQEDDYLSMNIIEPVSTNIKETYTQRRIRKAREVIFLFQSLLHKPD